MYFPPHTHTHKGGAREKFRELPRDSNFTAAHLVVSEISDPGSRLWADLHYHPATHALQNFNPD